MKKVVMGVLSMVVWSAGVSAGLSYGAEEAIPSEAQQLQEKASALKSYKTKFALEAKEEDGQTVRLEGVLQFQRPNQRRLELRVDGSDQLAQLLVSDGATEWQYDLVEKKVYRLGTPQQAPGPHQPFAEGTNFRFVQKVGSGREAVSRFEGEPLPVIVKDSPIPVQTLRVDVGPDGLVRQLALLDPKGEPVLSQKYSEIETNVSFPEGTFSFTPPQDVPVENLDQVAQPAP